MASLSENYQIEGLQASASLMPGNAYVIVEEDDSLTRALLWHTILAFVYREKPVAMVTSARPEKLIGDYAGADEVRHAIGKRAIAVLQMEAEKRAESLGRRVARLQADFRHFGVDRCTLVVVEGAEQMFEGTPDEVAALCRQWRDWSEKNDLILLMVLRQKNNDPVPGLLPVSRYFGGLARLKNIYGASVWEIFHWHHQGGVCAAKSLPLRLAADGRIELVVDDQPMAEAAPAADDTRIIALKQVFLPKEIAATGWDVIDEDLEALPQRLESALAATVVLPFSPTISFNRLARCIFGLRKACGPRLKIVIREINTRLRYSQERVVIRLGANIVVPAEVSFSRFQSFIAMVQGQVFPHGLPTSFEQAVADAAPDQEQGYLAPREFVQAISASLERSRVLNMQNVLLRLPLAYGLMPLDALRYCSIKRAGDLCSADETSVFLYLYGCRESDIDITLDRLFGLPIGELFAGEDRFLAVRNIQDAIDDFVQRMDAGAFPDLSAELASSFGSHRPERVLRPVVTEKKGPATVRYAPPPAAVRRPLSVRGTPTLTDVSANVT